MFAASEGSAEYGEGVRLLAAGDASAAVSALRPAAAVAGRAGAAVRLALCLLRGRGAAADPAAAVALLRRAAEAGDAEAQYQLAVCLILGTGAPPDEAEAERL